MEESAGSFSDVRPYLDEEEEDEEEEEREDRDCE